MAEKQVTPMDADIHLASSIVFAISQPAAVLDSAGRIIIWNPDFLSGLSQKPDDIDGLPIAQAFQPDDSASILENFAKVQSGLTIARFLVSVPSGPFLLKMDRLSGSKAPLYLCQLTPDAIIDGARLRFLMEHVDQGVWTYNALTGKFTVTDAWRRMRQLPAGSKVDENAESHEWLDAVHPDDRDMLRESFDGQRDGTVCHVDVQYRHRLADGQWLWILCRASVMSYDVNGHPVQVVGVDTDITEIKENEAAMTQLAEKMKMAVEVARIGVYEYDPATDRVHWDDRVLEIVGNSGAATDTPNEQWEKFIHPDDREDARSLGGRAFESRGSVYGTYRILRPDGEIRHLKNIMRVVRGEGGAGKLLGVNLDVTDDVRRTEELEVARARLEFDSRHDALTGLANRRLLDDYMMQLLEDLKPEQKYAILHLDLDFFKQINDTFGHAAGDAVLIQTSQTLSELVGDDGLVCRSGGDEFVVLLKTVTALRDLEKLCQAMIDNVARPYSFEGETCSIGVSIGCAVGLGAVNLRGASEVFLNADMALYAAKSDGRSCFRVFEPSMRLVSQDDARERRALQNALAEGEIVCYFQPQFDAKTKQFVGAEALARWNCPSRGVLTPDKFFPIVEKAGLAAQVDEYMFNHVLALQTEWAQAGLNVPMIALNISLDRLREDGMAEKVISALAPHHSISFELLETAFLDDMDTDIGAALDALRAAGVRIELDDFGSGHSSVVAMQSLKPDRVKIDRLLVAPLSHNKSQILTLKALVRVARLEGCDVVIEGVETAYQIETVSKLECGVLQGFGLGRPMRVDDFICSFLNRPKVMSG